MRAVVLLILAGFVSGVLGVTLALSAGFGWVAAFWFYTLGGNIGLLLTAVLIARLRKDDVIRVNDD